MSAPCPVVALILVPYRAIRAGGRISLPIASQVILEPLARAINHNGVERSSTVAVGRFQTGGSTNNRRAAFRFSLQQREYRFWLIPHPRT